MYDKVLLIRNTEHLYSSYLQFAYKKKLSTTICTLALKEVVNYYMENQSNVYSTFIDASKAFDMVRHDCLFKLLMKRKVPAVDLRLLINLYERQKVRTTWAGQYSSAFSTTNGIRQGSIASPILFCCYIDELITKLEAHGAGCWMSRYYCGALSYADDLTLLSPSLSGLRKQIKVCEEYAKLYGMTFNPTKTICVLFSRKPQETVPISLGGHQLVWCKFAKHLGNYISSDLRDAKEVSMKRSDLIGRVNTVLGNLHGVPRESVMKVFRSKCCHYYGSQAWQLDQNCVKDFATMWNRCVRRLLCLPNRTHTRFLHGVADMVPPMTQIARMFLSQVSSMSSSDNCFVKFLFRRSQIFTNTIIARNMHVIQRDKLTEVASLSTIDKCTVQVIRELVFKDISILTSAEQMIILNDICTL